MAADPATKLPEVAPLLRRLTDDVRSLTDTRDVMLVGIRTGGLWVAEHIAAALGLPGPGVIDIGFHRDDFGQRGLKSGIEPLRLEPVEGREVVLIDDVLHTGRTIRAAINVLFEFGRPQHIHLAVLLVRPGRQLPICADFVGAQIDVPAASRVKLRGPKPLELMWQTG